MKINNLNFKNFIINETVHDEYFVSHYKYEIPKDVIKLFYDFYVFSYLYKRNKNSLNINNKNVDIDDYQISLAKYGNWSIVDTETDLDNKDYDDELTHLLNHEVGDKLIPYLKNHLLEALFFSCACEIKNLLKFSKSRLLNRLNDEDLSLNQRKIINILFNSENNAGDYRINFNKYDVFHPYAVKEKDYYLKNYFDNNQKGTEDFKKFKPNLIKYYFNNFHLTDEMFYYLTLKNSILSNIEIIKELKSLFLDKSFWPVSEYGGKPWGDICQAYIDLYNSKNISQQLIQIDHVYDLHHNTGFALNKIDSYKKRSGIEEALYLRANVKNVKFLVTFVSDSFKPLCLRLFKSKFGMI